MGRVAQHLRTNKDYKGLEEVAKRNDDHSDGL